MKIKQLMKTTTSLIMVALLGVNMFLPVQASEEQSSIDTQDQSNESNIDTYPYTSIDEYGNINLINLPEINEEEIQKEREAQADSFEVVLTLGNSESVIDTFDTLEEAQDAQAQRAKGRSVGSTDVRAVSDYANISYGVVNFHTKTADVNTNFTETQTNQNGYLNGAYAADAAFLGYCSTDKSKIKFKQAGVVGCVSASDVLVYPYDNVKSVNSYKVANGTIYHYITTNVSSNSYASTINIGPKQSYMKDNVVYFSYDGHYFYTSYEAMIDDYKNDSIAKSINPSQPYYNYYQYLTQRTTTNYSASDLDAFINNKVSGNSKLKGLGSYFIEYQNKYGVNALLSFGVACNESSYGTSNIAMQKNNLFGLNAVDSNPGGNASVYANPQTSVEQYMKNYISRNYMDPKDVSGLYHGGHLGDKASGMNVKYASDSYWGEKAASISYTIDNASGKKDLGKYQLGIKDKMVDLRIRKEATPDSNELYKTGNHGDYPVVILGQTSGYSVEGNNVWYKIQSDSTLNGDRTAITQDVCVYDYNNAYAYTSSYYINRVVYTNMGSGELPNVSEGILGKLGLRNNGGYLSGFTLGSDVSSFLQSVKKADASASASMSNASGSAITSGTIATGQKVLIKSNGISNSYQIVVYGDTNGDGKILANDYVFIRNHIMGTGSLTGANIMAADVNRDGRVLANDYVFIRNHIMGVSSITQ